MLCRTVQVFVFRHSVSAPASPGRMPPRLSFFFSGTACPLLACYPRLPTLHRTTTPLSVTCATSRMKSVRIDAHTQHKPLAAACNAFSDVLSSEVQQLQQQPGVPGAPGPIGPRGHRGYQGDVGAPGAAGAPGKNGLRGFPGVPGLTGKPGRNGNPGAEGPQGVPFLQQQPAPQRPPCFFS